MTLNVESFQPNTQSSALSPQHSVLSPTLPILVVLAVAAPSVPAVRVCGACLETDEKTVRGACVDRPVCERGLEDHRLRELIYEADAAVVLCDREQVPERAAQVEKLFAERGRREDLRVLRK